jgi:hypothetical protein
MEHSPDHDDRDEAVEEAAEQAERAGQERQEMKRKAALADDADKPGDSDELERESEAHRQAAYEREDAASDRAHGPG